VRSSTPHPVAPPPRGILGLPDRLPYRVSRTPPSEDLDWCVERFWTSAWKVPAGRTVTARILPHPTVNITITLGHRTLIITGVAAGVFTRTLTGTDEVFGIKLQPGVAHLLTSVPIRTLDGLGQPAVGVLADAAELEDSFLAADSTAERISIAEQYLRRLDLTPPPELILVQDAVRELVEDPEVRRVADLTTRLGVSERTLQRLFADYLGVSPGWVLRRGRLHAAAERLTQLAMGGRDGLADVAAEFGYTDQSHLTNDFTKIIGMPPSSWLGSLLSESPTSS
jgi:AraC-like DNA-binding protein